MPIPTVMVSSTFYDLRQVRADIVAFLEGHLGYNALASEFPSFPVDPDVDTIENCRRRVREDADILVLVVGGRYGSIESKTDRSVTNLEYLTARGKGIPIYAFVEKQILNVLPLWESNPDSDYSSVVDTNRLFEFVNSLRNTDSIWTFPFETAQDIVGGLQIQLAHLFKRSIDTAAKLEGASLPGYLARVGPKSLRIALERPDAWEYRLFSQAWIDENDLRYDLVWEYEAGLAIGVSDDVSVGDAGAWVQTRLKEFSGLAESATYLVNETLSDAFGQPGEPGDPAKIVWVAQKLGAILEKAIRWSQRVRNARVEEPFDEVAEVLSRTPQQTIRELLDVPVRSLKQLEQALREPESDEERRIETVMTFEIENSEELNDAIQRAAERL